MDAKYEALVLKFHYDERLNKSYFSHVEGFNLYTNMFRIPHIIDLLGYPWWLHWGGIM